MADESTTPTLPKAKEDTVEYWKKQIGYAQKDSGYQRWRKQSKRVIKRYMDERDDPQKQQKRLNLLWSNVETIGPAVYFRTPKPEVERRYKDADATGRTASQLLERSSSYNLEATNFDDDARRIVKDYILIARGAGWVRYEPIYGDPITTPLPTNENDDGPSDPPQLGDTVIGDAEEADAGDDTEGPDTTGEDGQPLREVISESAPLDYVNWKDFLHKPVRTWKELNRVGWVARRHHYSKEQLKERFPKSSINEDYQWEEAPNGTNEEDESYNSVTFKTCEVWEIWYAPTRKAYWICLTHPEPLDIRDDPLKLREFFPCPRPLYGTMSNDSMMPVADYVEYQDQAHEIDKLTDRIDRLTQACRLMGIYDASIPALTRLVQEGSENMLVPVENWPAVAAKGGLEGVTSWMPLKEIVETLAQLVQQREISKQDLYEITGISDIVRGQSDPNETATAQTIKGRFASLRLEDRKKEVARFMRDCIRLQVEIIAEHFSPETILDMAGGPGGLGLTPAPLPPELQPQPQVPGAPPQDPQLLAQAKAQFEQQDIQRQVQQALDLIRNDTSRGYRIDIETDSTVAIDETQEKQDRVEFLTAVGTFMEKLTPLVQQVPEMSELAGEMLMFGVRAFKAGRPLEAAFERMTEQLKNRPPPQPQPDPRMVEAEANVQAKKVDTQLKVATTQADIRNEQVRTALDVEKAQREGALAIADANRPEERAA